MSTTSTAPQKFANPNADYSRSLTNATTVIFVFGTIAILGRIYARTFANKMEFGVDDGLAYLAWTGLLGNSVGNYMVAANHLVSNVPGTLKQDNDGLTGIHLVEIFYPYGMVAGKLSLLFLLRRIFTLRNKWFTFGWYFSFFLIFPIWFVMAYTWAGLEWANKISLVITYDYAAPSDSLVTLFTDLCILALPVGMISQLQLPLGRKIGIMAIFALGSLATIISLVRVILSILQSKQNWDARYSTYIEAILGLAEVGIVVICACLPVTRPLFVKAREFTSKTLSSLRTGTGTTTSRSRGTAISSRSRGTAISLGSQGYNDDEPINMGNYIHQRVDYDVAVEELDAAKSKGYPDSLEGKSGVTIMTRQKG